MQASFLSICAEHIINKCGDQFAGACIVFPTRRAALFFRKELAKHLSRPVFAPEILSINDFVDALTPVKTTDSIRLLFYLFRSYKKEFPHEPFVHYFHWGEMLLRDFDEIDVEGVHADKLFTAIHDWKEMESRFVWEPEELAAIQKFRMEFSLTENGLLQQSFMHTWNALPRIYRHFHQDAVEKKFASEGMAWSNALAAVSEGTLPLKWNRIFFCGFYFINRIHQQLALALNQQCRVQFLYDADAYYADDPFQEAGMAFRKMKKNFLFKGTYFSSQPKTITITGVPLGEMQVKMAGQIIREWMNDGTNKSTAIVLPDEKLLLPLLNSLPDEVKSFNVTMGFPAQHTVTGSFIRTLYELHAYSTSSSGRLSGLLLLPVLRHPGLPDVFKEKAKSLFDEMSKFQFLWIRTEQITDCGLEELLMYSPQNAEGVLDYLLNLLAMSASAGNAFENAVAAFIHEKLVEIKPEISALASEMDETSAWKLVMKIIRALRIPFSGEPVAGIQIMGMLETRALDFERLLILSANEAVLPANNSGSSFIPVSLRKAFGLPVAEHHDAVYAYHFYRLLQRAGQAHLIYDTEGKQFTGGEISRFAVQLMNEAEKKSDGKCKVIHRVVTAPLSVFPESAIEIRKSQEMMAEFKRKLKESENGLSASALTAYISCKLKFYFRYVAGLKEPDVLKEIPGPEVLGNLLHHAMEFLYGVKKQVSFNDIQNMKSGIDEAVKVAFTKVFPHPDTENTGYRFLNKQIVSKLVAAILETDGDRIPFEIKGLEKYFNAVITNELKAGGVIDRLQEKEGVLEILDYKSGKAELTADLDKVFSSPDHKAAFQLFYYAMLVRKEIKNIPLKAGLYVMKQLSGGISFLNHGEILSDEMINDFEKRVQFLLDEIFDPATAFTQTEDLKQCTYCPYAAVCKR